MQSLVRPELPTAALRSSQATHAAVDNSAPFATHPESTYKSGKVVQTSGATSDPLTVPAVLPQIDAPRAIASNGFLHASMALGSTSGTARHIAIAPATLAGAASPAKAAGYGDAAIAIAGKVIFLNPSPLFTASSREVSRRNAELSSNLVYGE